MLAIHPQYMVDGKGKRRSVVLRMKEFEEILKRLEDVYDVAEIERLKDEPCYPWDQVKAELKAKRRK
jgi:hypothetical protein